MPPQLRPPASSPATGSKAASDSEAPRSLLLDLDGVLVDTLPVMEIAWHAVQDAHGLDVPFAEYREHLGRPFDVIMECLGLANAEAIHRTYTEASTVAAHLARGFDGITDMLVAVAAAGWSLGVVTSKPLLRAKPLLAELGCTFAAVRGPDGQGRGKPAPDWILLALVDLGADPANATYVGDMAVDQEAACRAGVPYIHAGWGYGRPLGPSSVVADSPRELLHLLGIVTPAAPFVEGGLL
ncbi:HAD hydrolase-like protein [Streptomyces sp. SID13726]|uniref:HAD family hydrolase n=1 Tax=Streptomyces sp. SID13726 TaxID=2706058 RepID=UPI0013BC4F08|nr:HAD hydrolase-like protein [Streptomyces sp. SID13726]NEB01858.1 HAD family hydrolase [Streptomyces sp. SID13726]